MPSTSWKPSFRCCLALVLLLPLLALLTGCPKTTLTPEEAAPPVSVSSPLDEARNAFVRGDFAKAETLALRLSSDSALAKADQVEANRILAAAALQNQHPSVALTALDQWQKLSPGADAAREWQDAWCKALRGLSSHDARTRANAVYQDASRSALVRSIAGVCLAVRQWQDGGLGQSMEALENIYASASAKDKAMLEARLALELHLASPEASALAVTTVTEANKTQFPYTLILIDSLRRQSKKPDTREAAQATLNELAAKATLADPSLFHTLPVESSIAIKGGSGTAAPSGPVSGQPVVLALPQSGHYAAIAAKIIAGAQAACDEMSASGAQVSLQIIDTDHSDWLAKVESLPRNATVIGGPLRRDDYSKLKSRNLTSGRAVFAFLPGLESGDEGRIAWRFFSSAQDQVDTLLAFTGRLGIKGYGVLYPQENFGRRMSELFQERARAAGASTVVTESYEPGDQNNWMAAARNLLAANKSGSAFRAIFLPDSWKNMGVIVPNIFYYNETRQVLLGTSLWEQGLSGHSFVSTQYYGLAVFPGSWNAAHPTPAGAKLQARLQGSGKETADFWSGLGYDFARFSAGLGIREGWTANDVNNALQSVSLSWSIAPITWTNGLAQQRMHIFTPTANGFAPVNEQEFTKAFEQAWR